MGLNKPTDNLGATDEEVADSLREDVIAAFKICNQQRARIAALESEIGTKPKTYEFLDEDFLELMNDIGRLGHEKYGGDIAKTTGRKPGARWESKAVYEHARYHFEEYMCRIPHDHFGTAKHQLAAAAFNCMIEYIFSQGE